MNKNYCLAVCVLFVAAATLFSCSNGKTNGESRETYLNSLDSMEMLSSMIFWTSDTAFSTNRDLLLLLDTLYRHNRSDDEPLSIREEEKWMSAYRQQLCAYYDSHDLGSDSLSGYQKADSVLNVGVRLVEMDGDWSSMGAIVKIDIENNIDIFREYSLLSQCLEFARDEETRELIYEEWETYGKMEKLMSTIVCTICDFGGGSESGPMRLGCYSAMSRSRREVYCDILRIHKHESYLANGVYPEFAKQLFLNCSTKKIGILENVVESYDEYDIYKEMVQEGKDAIKELDPLITEWSGLWDRLDEKLASDYCRGDIQQKATSLLLSWAGIICNP